MMGTNTTEEVKSKTIESKYRAPALEKGLDVMELLAIVNEPLTSSQIASKLDKSLSEIFRMLQVLEARGYIKDIENRGFELTDKLFTLGLNSTPSRNLLTTCLPFMEKLAFETGQSCHLVVSSGDSIVVIARVEAPGDIGYSVRIGYKRRLIETLSGAILYGIQSPATQANMLEPLQKSGTKAEFKKFSERTELVAKQGFITNKSPFVEGVTDIAAPIISNGYAIASLVIPFISYSIKKCPLEAATQSLIQVASEISAEF